MRAASSHGAVSQLSASSTEAADRNLRELLLLDRGRALGANLEWIKAETVSGAFVQLMQLRDVLSDMDEAPVDDPDFKRLVRSRDRLVALIGATLIQVGEIGPDDFGLRHRWGANPVLREVLRDQAGFGV